MYIWFTCCCCGFQWPWWCKRGWIGWSGTIHNGGIDGRWWRQLAGKFGPLFPATGALTFPGSLLSFGILQCLWKWINSCRSAMGKEWEAGEGKRKGGKDKKITFDIYFNEYMRAYFNFADFSFKLSSWRWVWGDTDDPFFFLPPVIFFMIIIKNI